MSEDYDGNNYCKAVKIVIR